MMELYGTNQSLSGVQGYLGLPYYEYHQRKVSIYGIVSNFVDSKMAAIPLCSSTVITL